MAARTVATTDTIENFRTKFNSLSETDIGDLAGLTTTDKSSVVAAINEVIGGVNNFTIRDSSSTTQTIQGGDTLNFVGSGGINVTVSADDTVTISGSGGGGSDLVTTDGTQTLTNKTINGPDNTLTNIANASLANSDITIGSTSINLGATSTTISGLTSLQTESLSNSSGNLEVDSATNILEIKGDNVSVVGQLQLNCHVNTHGQIVASQPHSEAATNTLTLPGGNTIGNSDATLLSDTGTQTVTNKTLDADNNTVSNIGAAEIKADLITGQTELATQAADNDVLLIYDTDAGTIKKIQKSNIATEIPIGKLMFLGGLFA